MSYDTFKNDITAPATASILSGREVCDVATCHRHG